jgi:hypothetical protein
VISKGRISQIISWRDMFLKRIKFRAIEKKDFEKKLRQKLCVARKYVLVVQYIAPRESCNATHHHNQKQFGAIIRFMGCDTSLKMKIVWRDNIVWCDKKI